MRFWTQNCSSSEVRRGRGFVDGHVIVDAVDESFGIKDLMMTVAELNASLVVLRRPSFTDGQEVGGELSMLWIGVSLQESHVDSEPHFVE